MIVSFSHKGLELFHRTGSTRGVQAAHAAKLRLILTSLENAKQISDVSVPSWRAHALKGDMRGYWALTVQTNWRIIFKFTGEDVELADYLDYH